MRDGRIACTSRLHYTQDGSAALLLSQPCCAMALLAFKRTTYKLERGHDEARRRRRYAAAAAAAGLGGRGRAFERGVGGRDVEAERAPVARVRDERLVL